MELPDNEMSHRIARLTAELDRRGLDAIVLDDCEALHYFTGYEVSLSLYRACVIRRDGTGFIVLRALDVAPLVEKTWVKDVVGYPDWVHPAAAIGKAVIARELGKARIGIDLGSHALTNQMFNALRQHLPGVEFIDVDQLPWKLRKIKSATEIDNIRKASAIADATLGAIIDAARPGITERQAAAIAMESFVGNGGDPGMLGIITAGKEWDFLHGHLHDNPLTDGDILHLELCPRYRGYSARVMRCVVIGAIPDELEKTSRKLIELQDLQIAAMRPGAKAREVDAILRDAAMSSGIRARYDNITGYTVGYYSDQSLRGSDFTWIFHPKADWTLESGMVFHMYTSARGIAISETVHVGEDGPERLTKFDRRLFSA